MHGGGGGGGGGGGYCGDGDGGSERRTSGQVHDQKNIKNINLYKVGLNPAAADNLAQLVTRRVVHKLQDHRQHLVVRVCVLERQDRLDQMEHRRRDKDLTLGPSDLAKNAESVRQSARSIE